MAVLLVCDRCGVADSDRPLYTLEARSISGRAIIPLVDRREVQLCEECVAGVVMIVARWLPGEKNEN